MDDYNQLVTDTWHQYVPETRGYTVCKWGCATHVIFSVTDLQLVGRDGENFLANKIYPISRDANSGDLTIMNDKSCILIGFDRFIPCAYLRRSGRDSYQSGEKVVYLADYRTRRG